MTRELQSYYLSGIGIAASTYGIEVLKLSMGDKQGLGGEAVLEPIRKWCDLNVGMNSFKAEQVEDYVTTLLAGSAATFIRIETRRGPLKRLLGGAGLEMRFLREVWQCLQREPDRAVAIVFGSLGQFDDGDVEATTLRLWRRAVRLLRQDPQEDQLRRLASRLNELGQMTGQDIERFLKA